MKLLVIHARKLLLLFATIVCGVSFALAPLQVAAVPDSGQEPGANPDISKMEAQDPPEDKRNCAIEGFAGKMLCGVTSFFASINDAAFGLLSYFLRVAPLEQVSGTTSTSMYSAWNNFRNLANAFFILAFLVIIYSHITGMGLSNYNIKSIFPRLIVAALFINISYYICGIAVDISNILGQTLTNTIYTLTPPTTAGNSPTIWQDLTSSIILASAATAAAAYAAINLQFAALFPVAVLAAIALLITVLTLLLRQALIVVFIVISPLAFAALILPGTRSWFEKWQSNFMTLLLLFPAVAIVFGGAHFASIAIQRTAVASDNTLLSIVALGVQTIPLFITPIILALGGGFLNKFAGATKSKLPFNAAQKKSQEWAAKRSNMRDARLLRQPSTSKRRFRANAVKGRVTREGQDASLKSELSRAQDDHAQKYSSGEEGGDGVNSFDRVKSLVTNKDPKTKGERYIEGLAGTDDERTARRAKNHLISIKAKLHAEEVNASVAELEHDASLSFPDIVEMATSGMTKAASAAALANAAAGGAAAGAPGSGGNGPGGDGSSDGNSSDGSLNASRREAAILKIAKSGDIEGIIAMIKASSTMTIQQRITLVKAIRASNVAEKAPFLADEKALDNIMRGRVNEGNFAEKVVVNSINQGYYSPESFGNIDKNAAMELQQAISLAHDQAQADLRNTITKAFGDVRTNAKIGAQRDILIAISQMGTRL